MKYPERRTVQRFNNIWLLSVIRISESYFAFTKESRLVKINHRKSIMAAVFIKIFHTTCKNTGSILCAFLFICVSQTALQAATVQFETGHETGTMTGLHKHGTGTIDVSTSLVATGKYAAKYDLIRDNTIGHYRAENYPDNGSNIIEFNKEYWLSMNYIYTDWAKDRSAEIGPIQIHRVPSKWKAGCGGEVSAYNAAPFLMFSKNDEAQIITYSGIVSWSGPIIKNQWQKIIFHFKITWDNNGYIEAWKDGKKLFRRDGKLHERIDDCGQPFRNPTFHMGIYKWDWKLGSKQVSDSSRRTLYIDDLKIAQGPDGYDMVNAPASTETQTTPKSGKAH